MVDQHQQVVGQLWQVQQGLLLGCLDIAGQQQTARAGPPHQHIGQHIGFDGLPPVFGRLRMQNLEIHAVPKTAQSLLAAAVRRA